MLLVAVLLEDLIKAFHLWTRTAVGHIVKLKSIFKTFTVVVVAVASFID